MAKKLIDSMSGAWDPGRYHDESREALKKIVEEKVAHGGKMPAAPHKKAKPSNVIDLVSVLQQSIKETQGKSHPAKTNHRRAHKKAA